jgi:hypothetical protein
VLVTSNASPAEPVDGGWVTFTGPSAGAGTEPRIFATPIVDGENSVIAVANGIGGGPYFVVASAAGDTSVPWEWWFRLTNLGFQTYLPWI